MDICRQRNTVPQRPSVIVFDFVGTLVVPIPGVAQVYFEYGRRAGSRFTLHQVATRFDKAYRHADWSVANDEAQRQAWRSVVHSVFADVQDREALFAALWQHFAESQRWRVFGDVIPAWNTLNAAGLTLAIASNFDSRIRSLATELGLAEHVVGVFHSAELGHAKPSRAFFDTIARKLDVSPSELMSVGDDVRMDVQAAQRAGWQAAWIHRSAEGSSHAMHSLHDLPRWLDISS